MIAMHRLGTALGGGIAAMFWSTAPGLAAERLSFSLGLLEFSVATQDLEALVETDETNGLLDRLDGSQAAQLRSALQTRYNVPPLVVSQFSRSSSGEKLLEEVGELVRTPSGRNGDLGLRSALVLAAADPQGLTLLNVIRYFPTDIEIDIGTAIRRIRRFTDLIAQTEQATQALQAQSQTAARQQAAAPPSQELNALSQPGPYAVGQRSLSLQDRDRDRQLATDLYFPRPTPAVGKPARVPAIVVSNGLGSGRSRFAELAEHLASHGFAVAIPDHPGSDKDHLRDFYGGRHPENFTAESFLERPRDISFVLDELVALDLPEVPAIDVEGAGVFGYSYGGTTALSLAGARIDPDHLQTACETELALVNISLLYQCRALELPRSDLRASLQDPRIGAVYAFVPFGRSLFGPEGLSQVTTPVFWEAVDLDVLTPLAIEQLPMFSWLTTPERYLMVADKLPHARLTLDVANALTDRPQRWEDLKPIVQTYRHTMGLAFFKTYLASDEGFRAYLSAESARALTVAPHDLSLLRSLPGNQTSP